MSAPILMEMSRIRRTEEVCPRRVSEVLAMIRNRQAWTHPICVERTVGAILDGHHRYAAARRLGLEHVPVRVFDYAEVELTSWRPDLLPTRDEVLARAVSGRLFPQKTTRHVFVDRAMRPIPLIDLFEGRAFMAGEDVGAVLGRERGEAFRPLMGHRPG